jgi:hypothetical protein
MADKPNVLQGQILDAILRNSAFSSPAAVYVALFTTAPDDAYTSGVPTGVEVSGNAYARQVITFGAPSGTPRAVASDIEAQFPAANPGAWGTVTHFGIFDDPTAGNLLYWHALTDPKTVGAGDILRFATGTLVVTEN